MPLPSGLEEITAGTEGWNNINTSNFQLLDQKLVNVMTAAAILGTIAVADKSALTALQLTDSTTGTASNTIGDVGASFSQTTLNNINASLVDEINKLQSDLDNMRTKYNELLAALRKTGGMGVLADTFAALSVKGKEKEIKKAIEAAQKSIEESDTKAPKENDDLIDVTGGDPMNIIKKITNANDVDLNDNFASIVFMQNQQRKQIQELNTRFDRLENTFKEVMKVLRKESKNG